MTAEVRRAGETGSLSALPLLLPVPKAAEMLGISRAAAYRHANSGALPCKRLGRRIYVITARLHELIDTEVPAS
jgi:hypothetical protein